MPSLSQVFTNIANAIRTKSETSDLYSPIDMPQAILDIETGIDTSDATAIASDILSTKTAYVVGEKVIGSMTNNGAVSQALNCGGSYTVPAGYHNGNGTVTANSLASQTGVDSGKIAVTATTMVSGYQGWVNGTKISGTFTGQTKSTKPTTRSSSAATITPDSGKYLTSVTVDTTSVPNSNSGVFTITSSHANWYTGNVDMGNPNSNRYVNAVNVYNKGKADGGLQSTTLWTNSNPSASQGGITATLSQSMDNFTYIKFVPVNDGATPTTTYLVSEITAGKYLSFGYTGYDSASNWYAVMRRLVRTSATTFAIESTNGTGAYNAYAKVYQIIGMK